MIENTDITAAIKDYPRLKARTLRFSGAAPRSARLIGDGSRMLFLRSDSPTDLANSLWMSWFDADGAHHETKVADPRDVLGDAADEEVPAEERARRERAREGGAGIVSYSVSGNGSRAVFTLNNRLFVVELTDGSAPAATVREVLAGQLDGETTPVLNPRISPDGAHILYTTGEHVQLVNIDADTNETILGVCAADDGAEQTWKIGLAEFAAGEEMDRYDGFWWAPDSRHAIVESFDMSEEPVWSIADPAHPFSYGADGTYGDTPATPDSRHYPRALTRNAKVRLDLVTLPIDGAPLTATDIAWDKTEYEYLARVSWSKGRDPLLLVQNRRQTRDQVLAVDQTDGSTRTLETHENPQWIDIVNGTPAYTPDGRLVTALNDMAANTNRLAVDGAAFTPAGWNVREVLDVSDADVLAIVQRNPAIATDVPAAWADTADWHDARCHDVVRLGFDGSVTPITVEPGVWTASRAGEHGEHIVVTGRGMAEERGVMRHDGTEIANNAAVPGFAPNTRFVTLPGEHGLLAAITAPSPSSPFANADAGKLPVLMKPYGGPGAQQVLLSQSYYWDSQWWADQGFLVVTADGRGTTGRGPVWDREIFEDMKDVTLADQVEAVRGLETLIASDGGERWRELWATPTGCAPGTDAGDAQADAAPTPDLDKVTMIGWSYGGFLSALAVLDAPDVFKAACAGAPPTDWTLYDTHYTERYLGLDPAVYAHNSIVQDAPKLVRPLMLIHGFADDNVTIAHSLRLSQALMAAGRQHTFLPLTGITHMTNDETVAENLLILQRDFLKEALDD